MVSPISLFKVTTFKPLGQNFKQFCLKPLMFIDTSDKPIG